MVMKLGLNQLIIKHVCVCLCVRACAYRHAHEREGTGKHQICRRAGLVYTPTCKH